MIHRISSLTLILFLFLPRMAAAQAEPVLIEHGGGVVKIFSGGKLVRQQPFPDQSMQGTLDKHSGGTRMTLSQSSGADLVLSRFCARDTDFIAIADSLQEHSAQDIGAGQDIGWESSFTVDGIGFDYALFDQPDGSYQGFGRQQGSVGEDGSILTLHLIRLTPLADPDMDEPLPTEPEFSDDQRDLALDLLAEVLGLPREGLSSYVRLSRVPGGGDTGFGPGVVAEIVLDDARRAISTSTLRDQPCADGDDGKPATILTVRLFREGSGGEAPEVQIELSDPESGDISDFGIEDAAGETRADYGEALSEAAAQLQSGEPVTGLGQ